MSRNMKFGTYTCRMCL